ncbi:MAG TPA: EscU/YscU/HrcU family type III secretion system export apparatus switch protein [Planctomycetes bacterium]|nr:EscU/YscU/HrcU family type III secretion system export apparatus switch protein [Planctomycetota bacterium]HIN79449.1 EscU/YscU/HrcU family type III secretion system export apparatus switch protein [Planctomycetota bacterium]
MANVDDSADRVHLPTARRLEMARREGKVARSSDLTTAVVLLSGLAAIYLLLGHFFEGFTLFTEISWEGLAAGPLTLATISELARRLIFSALQVLLPLLAVLLLAGVSASILQVGFRWTPSVIAPNLERLDPIAGFTRILSKRSSVRLLFGSAKLLVVGAILYEGVRKLLIGSDEGQVVSLVSVEPSHAVAMGGAAFLDLAVRLAIALLLLATLDWFFQRYQHQKDLMMTSRELREELRDIDGDPAIKQRRAQLHRKLVGGQIRSAIGDARVLILSPGRCAIALDFDLAEGGTPKVLFKGRGHIAEQMRELAVARGVSTVSDVTLAESLHSSTEVGEEIPREFYQPVAEIIGFVQGLHKQPKIATERGGAR